jgi:hypothetical protein
MRRLQHEDSLKLQRDVDLVEVAYLVDADGSAEESLVLTRCLQRIDS